MDISDIKQETKFNHETFTRKVRVNTELAPSKLFKSFFFVFFIIKYSFNIKFSQESKSQEKILTFSVFQGEKKLKKIKKQV